MNFISFIKKQQGQQDPRLKRFVDFAKADPNFPSSSDPAVLAEYLYNKLDPDQTLSFQNWLMIYKQLEPSNELPPAKDERDFLRMINLIIDKQNADPDYVKKYRR